MKKMFLGGLVLLMVLSTGTSFAQEAEKGWIGLEVKPATKELLDLFDVKAAVIVSKVFIKSPAMALHIQKGDVIIRVDREDAALSTFTIKVNNLKIGSVITLTLFDRGDNILTAVKKPDVVEEFLRKQFDRSAPQEDKKQLDDPLSEDYWNKKFNKWTQELLADPSILLDFKNWVKEKAGDVLADFLEVLKKKIERLQDDKNLLDKLFDWARKSFSRGAVDPLPRFGKAYFGVRASNPTEHMLKNNQLGVVVEKVLPGTPAEKTGIKAGDRIFRFGEFTIRNKNDLKEALRKSELGTEVEIRVVRYFGRDLIVRSFKMIVEEK